MKNKYLKLRFQLWLKSNHFKRFKVIMIVICLIVMANCVQGNYISISVIPVAILLFGGFTLFPKYYPTHGVDQSLEEKINEKKKEDYKNVLREKKLKRILHGNN